MRTSDVIGQDWPLTRSRDPSIIPRYPWAELVILSRGSFENRVWTASEHSSGNSQFLNSSGALDGVIVATQIDSRQLQFGLEYVF